MTSTLTTYYFPSLSLGAGFGGAYEVQSNGVNTTTRTYYTIAGMTVAMQECTDGTCADLVYFLTDHLGSVVAVTGAGDALLSQQRYLPFGGVRTSLGEITETDLGYTGQRNLDAQGKVYSLGLMDYKARFYDPYITHLYTQTVLNPISTILNH